MAGPSAIENLFDQLRSVNDEDFKIYLTKVHHTLESNDKGQGHLTSLRHLYSLIFCTKFERRLPKELVTRLKRLLIEPNQGSGRIRIACNTVLCEYCPTESLVIDSMNTLPDDKQIPYILPVVNNQGRNIGQLEKLFIPQLVRWISTVGFDYEIQTRSLSCLANAVMLHQSILDKEQMHIVSSQLADWLRNASVHQAQNPFSRKVFKGEEGSLVTDIDGTASRDIFTILSIGHYYSGDQLLNIHSFSMLKSWLISSHPSAIPLDKASLETSESYSSGFSTRARGVLKEKSCEYCLRIIDQCERKPMKAQDGHLQHACLVEVLSILDILCQQDNTLIARLFPTIKRVYLQIADNMDYPRVHLALIQFFLNHGDTVMYDPQQAYETFFTKLLSLHYLEESAAFDIIMFLQDNLAVLSLQTNIIEKYFPNLLRILAWNSRTFLSDFVDILPSMVSATTAIEVFHTLVDLPCMSAALEVMCKAERFESTAPSRTGGDIAVIPGSSLEAYLTPRHRPLFHFLTRMEGGHGDTIDRLSTLHQLLDDMKQHPRVTVCSQGVPVLLNLYFQTLLQYADIDLVCKLVPVIIERSGQIYGLPFYQQSIRRVLADNILAMFKLYPSLIILLRSDIIDFICVLRNVNDREDFFIHLVWLIGEYCSSVYDERCTPEIISKYYEALETLSYEISADTSDTVHYTVRLLTVLMSAMAKLASRCQDLISRVLLCLSKISQQQQKYNRSEEKDKLALISRANELVNLLKLPNIASSILSPAADIDSGKWHTDHNTSVPMLLRTTTNIIQQFNL